MIEAGIVDPAKVVRTALQDAASVAGLLITTEAMIGDKPKKDSARDADGRRRRRHGRHGLLSPRHQARLGAKGRPKGRPFCWAGVLSLTSVRRAVAALRLKGAAGDAV